MKVTKSKKKGAHPPQTEEGRMTCLRKRLAKDVEKERRHMLSLIVSADCTGICFDTFLNGGVLCEKCETKLKKELSEYGISSKNFSETASKFSILCNANGIFRGGTRFILEVPPRSFRNLKRKPNRLRAYKEIIKLKMKRHTDIFEPKKELLLYLAIHINDNYERTDCDNVAKSMCDALGGVLYTDDKQVKVLVCEKIKVHANKDEGFVIAISKIP